jgi:adenosine deaminase
MDQGLDAFVRGLPKAELHVHLEGSIRPETLLELSRRHQVRLPAETVEELRAWYRFVDFPHFAEVYGTISRCLQQAEDIELITRQFLKGQAEQNILHSEVTYTAFSICVDNGIPFEAQLAAIHRARAWGEQELGVTMSLTLDIPRERVNEAESLRIADWAISGMEAGITGFGLGGLEVGFPPERFAAAFDRAREAGLKSVPHAGETDGAGSIRGALEALGAVRLGHGVRCLEDPALVEELRQRQIPLEVCLSSNVCLKVTPSLEQHPLPRLLEAGLYVTLNSDDPPMFNTTLVDEYRLAGQALGLGREALRGLALNAVRASFLPEGRKAELEGMVRGYEG